jgi:hypothetical protein
MAPINWRGQERQHLRLENAGTASFIWQTVPTPTPQTGGLDRIFFTQTTYYA